VAEGSGFPLPGLSINALSVRRASASNPNAFARVGVAAGLVPAPDRREERPQGPRLRRRRENRQSLPREWRGARSTYFHRSTGERVFI